MATEIFNRKEKKYMLSGEQYHQIIQLINEKMIPDRYNQDGDFYNIYNIYYDTDDDALIRASIEKPVYKEKFRLRTYSLETAERDAFLEIKKKYKGIVNKRRVTVSIADAYSYLNNGCQMKELSSYERVNKQILSEIDYFKQFYNIRPKVFISYKRRAYYDKEDKDFRVTFDKDITTRRDNLNFESGNYGEKLLSEDVYLMEIKITGAVPLWFVKIISELNIYPASFSKYGTEYKKYLLKKKEII